MTVFYFFLGVIIAIIGALPLGAVNLAVINTSIKEDIKNASYIALAAGIGEVTLAAIALHCSMEVSNFFYQHQWIQIGFIIAFFLTGIYFMYLAFKRNQNTRKRRKLRLFNSKFLTGFVLALINPPVIIYWILAISLTNKYIFKLTVQNSLSSLLFFFIGIYLGKITTLYFYGKWGNKMAQKQEGSKTRLHRIIGIALIVISIVQGIKFAIE